MVTKELSSRVSRVVNDIEDLARLLCVFRPKPATDSDGSRPQIPTQGGHLFLTRGGAS